MDNMPIEVLEGLKQSLVINIEEIIEKYEEAESVDYTELYLFARSLQWLVPYYKEKHPAGGISLSKVVTGAMSILREEGFFHEE